MFQLRNGVWVVGELQASFGTVDSRLDIGRSSKGQPEESDGGRNRSSSQYRLRCGRGRVGLSHLRASQDVGDVVDDEQGWDRGRLVLTVGTAGINPTRRLVYLKSQSKSQFSLPKSYSILWTLWSQGDGLQSAFANLSGSVHRRMRLESKTPGLPGLLDSLQTIRNPLLGPNGLSCLLVFSPLHLSPVGCQRESADARPSGAGGALAWLVSHDLGLQDLILAHAIPCQSPALPCQFDSRTGVKLEQIGVKVGACCPLCRREVKDPHARPRRFPALSLVLRFSCSELPRTFNFSCSHDEV